MSNHMVFFVCECKACAEVIEEESCTDRGVLRKDYCSAAGEEIYGLSPDLHFTDSSAPIFNCTTIKSCFLSTHKSSMQCFIGDDFNI